MGFLVLAPCCAGLSCVSYAVRAINKLIVLALSYSGNHKARGNWSMPHLKTPPIAVPVAAAPTIGQSTQVTKWPKRKRY